MVVPIPVLPRSSSAIEKTMYVAAWMALSMRRQAARDVVLDERVGELVQVRRAALHHAVDGSTASWLATSPAA